MGRLDRDVSKGSADRAESRPLGATRPLEQPVWPVAVGGVGGSGTRLVAQVLRELGYFLGDDLNESLDNLWFTLLFKRREILGLGPEEFSETLAIFVSRMSGQPRLTAPQLAMARRLAGGDRGEHSPQWLKERADTLAAEPSAASTAPWAWKEPNTHVVIDRLIQRLPGLRYIHVLRNGLDMAYSANQNQLRFWGEHFIGQGAEVSPRASLSYWCRVHQRVLRLCAPLGERFLLLNYDRLCADPVQGLRTLVGFLGLSPEPDRLQRLVALAHPPASLGRFKRHGLDCFDPADVAFVAGLGFDTSLD